MRDLTLDEKILTVLSARSQLTAQDEFNLKRLTLGRQGEQDCYHLIQSFGKEEWRTFPDVQFDLNGYPYQIDLIVLTHTRAFVIEVKNYQADIEVIKSDIFYNNKELIHNPYAQVKKNCLAFKSYSEQAGFDLEVDYILVFINPNHSCSLTDESLNVFDRPKMRHFLTELKTTDPIKPTYPLDSLSTFIASSRSNRSFTPVTLIPEQLKKGSYCLKCLSYQQELSRYKITCRNCGQQDDKRSALAQLTDEWCVLHYNEDITTSALVDFSCGQFKRAYVNKFLKDRYSRKNQTGTPLYSNPYGKDFI